MNEISQQICWFRHKLALANAGAKEDEAHKRAEAAVAFHLAAGTIPGPEPTEEAEAAFWDAVIDAGLPK